MYCLNCKDEIEECGDDVCTFEGYVHTETGSHHCEDSMMEEIAEPEDSQCCEHPESHHFSCEVGSFCKSCPSNDNTWEHVFAEGVAAPLEPTWNDIDYFVLVIDHGEIAGVARFEVRVGSENVYNTVIESLADAKAESLKKNISAYAAAVSKNLQEELAELSRVITERFGELKCSTKDDEGNQLDASDLVCILATRLELSRQNFAKAESRISELEKEIALVKRVLLQHLNDEDFEYSLVGLYTKLTENDDAGKSPR